MIVAIVGSRGFLPLENVRQYVRELPCGTTVLSGGARGVDAAAFAEAVRVGLHAEEILADWKTHGRAAGPIRNAVLVERADRIVAFWDGRSRGTASTIALARKANKPCDVIVSYVARGRQMLESGEIDSLHICNTHTGCGCGVCGR